MHENEQYPAAVTTNTLQKYCTTLCHTTQ